MSDLARSGTMLAFTICLAPERILDGGWRGWAAAVCSAGVVLWFLSDLRETVRRRRAARSTG
ncbi:hypothetical protein [Actinoplanes subglobosus]|uniref:Uncharacterized protein n=1 Tax=Actinoplanes subglobosus TaxID=1547892 RepID=A0ABV8IXM8_9ACTN